jgi:hypothetical protein
MVSPNQSRVGTRYSRYMSKAPAIRLPACMLPSSVGALGREGIAGKVPRHGNPPLTRPGCSVAVIPVMYGASNRRGKSAGRSQKGDESWGEAWRVESPHPSESRHSFRVHSKPNGLREKPSCESATSFLTPAMAGLRTGTRTRELTRPDYHDFLLFRLDAVQRSCQTIGVTTFRRHARGNQASLACNNST